MPRAALPLLASTLVWTIALADGSHSHIDMIRRHRQVAPDPAAPDPSRFAKLLSKKVAAASETGAQAIPTIPVVVVKRDGKGVHLSGQTIGLIVGLCVLVALLIFGGFFLRKVLRRRAKGKGPASPITRTLQSSTSSSLSFGNKLNDKDEFTPSPMKELPKEDKYTSPFNYADRSGEPNLPSFFISRTPDQPSTGLSPTTHARSRSNPFSDHHRTLSNPFADRPTSPNSALARHFPQYSAAEQRQTGPMIQRIPVPQIDHTRSRSLSNPQREDLHPVSTPMSPAHSHGSSDEGPRGSPPRASPTMSMSPEFTTTRNAASPYLASVPFGSSSSVLMRRGSSADSAFSPAGARLQPGKLRGYKSPSGGWAHLARQQAEQSKKDKEGM
ncbi:hypothetical protein MNV49_001736 [Pseudohyphozyma bogoriensis]|nr:hypothetical protein MNV49_001736 [Pseudohyphozyma bogoriensis]